MDLEKELKEKGFIHLKNTYVCNEFRENKITFDKLIAELEKINNRIDGRQLKRKYEITERLKDMGLEKYASNGMCYEYIKNNKPGNIDLMVREIEAVHFYDTYTNIRNIGGYNKSYEERKKQAFEQYMFDNCYNVHKVLREVPWCMKGLVDEFYKKIHLMECS